MTASLPHFLTEAFGQNTVQGQNLMCDFLVLRVLTLGHVSLVTSRKDDCLIISGSPGYMVHRERDIGMTKRMADLKASQV